MRAHALRRVLWFLCLLCVAGAVGVGAWYMTEVKPALAKAPFPKNGKVPEKWQDIDKAFTKRMRETSGTVLRPAVDLDTFTSLLKRDYSDRIHPHFVFTGPMPPEVKPPPPPEETIVKPKIVGLAKLGAIKFAFYQSGEGTQGTVAFEFKGGDTKYLRFGQPFGKKGQTRPGDNNDPLPYTFLKSKVLGPRHVEFTYSMADPTAPDADPEILTIEWDGKKKVDPATSNIIRVKEPEVPAAEEEGTEREATAGNPSAQPVETQPTVSTPADQLTMADLEPEIERVNSRRFNVGFDDNTVNFFRGRNAEKMLEQVKTSERTLPSGESGVEIVDSGETPADKLGIKRGDVIVSINGVATPNREAILRVARTFNENTTRVTVVVDRNGRKITYNVDPRDPKTRRAAAQAAARAGN